MVFSQSSQQKLAGLHHACKVSMQACRCNMSDLQLTKLVRMQLIVPILTLPREQLMSTVPCRCSMS